MSPSPRPPDDERLPEDIRELDRLLASIRFEPRASLGPEVLGRVRRGPEGGPARRRRLFRGPVAGILLAATATVIWTVARPVDITVDRCCYDLDGGDKADDGIAVVVRSGEQIRRIAIYEDRDGSGNFTPGDALRFDRPPALALPDAPMHHLVTLRYCCSDYDGEGPEDDGLVIVAAPPDRVTMVALYERSTGTDPAAPTSR